MDFDEIIYGMNQVVFSLSRSVRYRAPSQSQIRESIEWSSYVIAAGDDIIDAILCSSTDITDTLRSLRNKYRKASRLAKRVNPGTTTNMFDVYTYVLDDITDYILRLEAKSHGR